MLAGLVLVSALVVLVYPLVVLVYSLVVLVCTLHSTRNTLILELLWGHNVAETMHSAFVYICTDIEIYWQSPCLGTFDAMIRTIIYLSNPKL